MDLDDTRGVMVEGVKTGGPANRGNLRRGQVIVALDDQPVSSLAEFEALYGKQAPLGRDVLVEVKEQERRRWVLIQRGEVGR